jgi:Zn2+/Cd2+-exporting ATPase
MTSPHALKHVVHSKDPVPFDEFFDLGQEETLSPFITLKSRAWGSNLSVKASILATVLLILSFILSWYTSQIALSNLLLAGVYFFAGIPSLIESIDDLASFEVNIDILMTLAAFSSVLIGSGMEGGLLLVLFALSGSMEDLVTSKAKSSISSLHKLSPTKANVIKSDGSIIERSIKDISVGTNILIKSGQVIPLDGIVVDGISSVNLVHLTGENLPVTKKVGDIVPAGGRNMEGTLTVQVTHTSADSTLARIIQLVTQAQEERPLLQRWFDKLSKTYAITIMGLAGIFALTLPLFIAVPYLGVEGSVYRALAFLIAASPCALIIAIPIAYLSALGVCARQGILLKGGIALDALSNCKAIAFDKTGTLTTGELTFEGIESVVPVSSKDLERALAIAYALEKNAVHPIAKAVLDYGQTHRLETIPLKDFEAIPGYGLSATIQGPDKDMSVYIGRPAHIISKIPEDLAQQLQRKIQAPQERGELVAVLLVGERLFILLFKDTLRPNILNTIDELKNKLGLRLVMLTGDHEYSARRIARELGIDEYHADLHPEDKLNYVCDIAATQGLAMIGDGVNDAPALARANVGICMGKIGSTAAIDAADVILLHDNIELMGWLMNKAHQTQRIVRQNLGLATLAIIIASLPALAGFIPLWLAVVLHEGGTVLVGLNGLRLLKK